MKSSKLSNRFCYVARIKTMKWYHEIAIIMVLKINIISHEQMACSMHHTKVCTCLRRTLSLTFVNQLLLIMCEMILTDKNML